ncbi:growth-regulating factor 5-like [Asparagus officinalis]|nr:growth-regulating factor 5-like [Asparagus officinalis]
MMNGGNSNNNNSYFNFSRYPFTPTQWQELEQQALIYKYMASGIPIPSDLLLPIKRSSFLSCPQPTAGWSFLQMGYGFGRKAEDPEPGRCRRTDGKKWRCSKEAYPDSKYCERHMHRGKNRSRKPVEISINSTSNKNSISPYPQLYPQSNSWELRPLGLGEPKQRQEKAEHCFVLGADFKNQRPVKERDFFEGESSSLGSSSSSSSSYSKTQLSISIPMGLHDFTH